MGEYLAIADINGKRLNDIRGVEIAPEMARMTLAAIKAQQPYRDFLCSWQPSPGARKRWVGTNAVPIVDRSGEFHGYRGVCRDITAQIEAEEALRQSEQRFRQLFEIGSDYSWEMDAEYRMSYVSPSYEAVVGGVPASEALGKRFAVSLPASGSSRKWERWPSRRKTKKNLIATSSIRESSPMARYAGSR